MIRKAEIQDLPTLTELACKLWPHHAAEEILAEFGLGITNPDTAFFLAYAEETAIGLAQCGLRHDYVEGTSSSPGGDLEETSENKKRFFTAA